MRGSERTSSYILWMQCARIHKQSIKWLTTALGMKEDKTSLSYARPKSFPNKKSLESTGSEVVINWHKLWVL